MDLTRVARFLLPGTPVVGSMSDKGDVSPTIRVWCAKLNSFLLPITASSVTVKALQEGHNGTTMSTIREVRAAEAKMKSVLDGLNTAKAEDPNYLGTELRSASDEYGRAVRE